MLFAVLLLHATYVAFVIAAPVFVLHAGLTGAPWGRPLRWLHVAVVGFIAAQFAFDWSCPLSVLENSLSGRALDAERIPAMHGYEFVITLVVVGYLVVSAVGHGVAWRRAEIPCP